jgi:hypothetical protein
MRTLYNGLDFRLSQQCSVRSSFVWDLGGRCFLVPPPPGEYEPRSFPSKFHPSLHLVTCSFHVKQEFVVYRELEQRHLTISESVDQIVPPSYDHVGSAGLRSVLLSVY